jgi:hypothetical protein
MPSTITATLERHRDTEPYISFVILGKSGFTELDSIFIERKTKGKHRDKACWSIFSHYKAWSIGDWLFRLEHIGFDTSEFEQACIEMGWGKEVEEWRKEPKTEWNENPVDEEDKNIYFSTQKEE